MYLDNLAKIVHIKDIPDKKVPIFSLARCSNDCTRQLFYTVLTNLDKNSINSELIKTFLYKILLFYCNLT